METASYLRLCHCLLQYILKRWLQVRCFNRIFLPKGYSARSRPSPTLEQKNSVLTTVSFIPRPQERIILHTVPAIRTHVCVGVSVFNTNPMCSQVLLCFSRDTAVLDHFKYNSATPPKSVIQGEMVWPSSRTHTHHHHMNSQEQCFTNTTCLHTDTCART